MDSGSQRSWRKHANLGIRELFQRWKERDHSFPEVTKKYKGCSWDPKKRVSWENDRGCFYCHSRVCYGNGAVSGEAPCLCQRGTKTSWCFTIQLSCVRWESEPNGVKPYIQTTIDSDFSTKLHNILNEPFNPAQPTLYGCGISPHRRELKRKVYKIILPSKRIRYKLFLKIA